MTVNEALNVLGIGGNGITMEVIKNTYRKLIKEYHPDRNSAGLEMSQMITAAYNALKEKDAKYDFSSGVDNTSPADQHTYLKDVEEAIQAIIDLPGIIIEVCGCWVWISGDTKAHKDALKEAGYRYAAKKQQWYYRPAGGRRRRFGKEWSMDEIRSGYGSHVVNGRRDRDEDRKPRRRIH